MSWSTGAEPQAPVERLVSFLYDAAWGAIATLTKPLLLPGKTRWREKSGYYAPHSVGPHCWIHACSVGEVRVALRLLEEIRRQREDICFTLSTITPEGFSAAKAGVVDKRDRVTLFPFDARRVMKRAFERLKPDFMVLTEVELWPNHLREAAAREIPVFVVNGRLTAKDERNYRRAGRFMRRTFAVPELVCARGAAEADRFRRLGARRVAVAGDMKYETLPNRQSIFANRSDRLVFGASTHAGEEEVLLAAVKKMQRDFPSLRLVLAPRHPRRAAKIRNMAMRMGLAAGFSSSGEAPVEVLVVNEIGRLKEWYAQATVCFVGKSLTARGGQNFLEAAACGCPVVTGPYLENFAEAAERFLAENAIRQVNDGESLQRALTKLLADEAERDRMAASAAAIIRESTGATKRTADLILGHLGTRI